MRRTVGQAGDVRGLADDNDDVGPLFEWYVSGGAELVDGGPAKVSQASADYFRPTWAASGRW